MRRFSNVWPVGAPGPSMRTPAEEPLPPPTPDALTWLTSASITERSTRPKRQPPRSAMLETRTRGTLRQPRLCLPLGMSRS